VTRRFQDLQPDPPEFENLVVAQRRECEGCVCRSAQSDSCAHTIAQLQMSGNKIGVEMRQEYIFNFESVLAGKNNVLVNVPLRVNDGCRT
jgi:hypothetical protein